MAISKMTTNGTLLIQFSQPILAPENIQQGLYQNVFEFWVESFLNDTRYFGRIRDEPARRQLEGTESSMF